MNNASCCRRWCARADALLDVHGIHVVAVENTAREQIISVESDQILAGCPVCGVVAIGHGRRVVRLHDTPAHGRPVRWIGPSEYGAALILIALLGRSRKRMRWRR